MDSSNVKIGYACINLDTNPSSYKTCRKQNITEEKLREIIEHNLLVLEKSIDYNIKNQIKMFRVSSSLIPFGSSSLNTLDWQQEFKAVFRRIRHKISQHAIRISMHPGQYTVINSPDPLVVKSSIAELDYHAKIIEFLAPTANSKMILHIGGIYNDKQAAMQRFIDVYQNELSDSIKRYLIIENDDRLYTIEDALLISNQTGIPVVFDNLHHAINPSLQTQSMSKILESVVNTWKTIDGKPKMHYSQQAKGKRIGAHSDTINLKIFMDDFRNIYDLVDVDIMLEVKDKNRSAIKVNQLFNKNQRILEQEWARYKYWVMARSQQHYDKLRVMFKNNQEVDVISFYEMIDELRDDPLNPKAQLNALLHVWGYFKKQATTQEKERFIRYQSNLSGDITTFDVARKYLRQLSKKYEISYLTQSYYFE